MACDYCMQNLTNSIADTSVRKQRGVYPVKLMELRIVV